jgi:hypothetical protein
VKVNWCFGETYRPHLQSQEVSQERNQKEAGWLSQDYVVLYPRTLGGHCCEKLKSNTEHKILKIHLLSDRKWLPSGIVDGSFLTIACDYQMHYVTGEAFHLLNVVIKWIALLPYIRSNLGVEAGCPWKFSWFSWTPPVRSQDITSNYATAAFFQIHANSLLPNHHDINTI